MAFEVDSDRDGLSIIENIKQEGRLVATNRQEDFVKEVVILHGQLHLIIVDTRREQAHFRVEQLDSMKIKETPFDSESTYEPR